MRFDSYFQTIEQEVKNAYKIAESARAKGFDPETYVEISLSLDLAEKAVKLVSGSLYPELDTEKIIKRIKELEKEYGKGDDRVAFFIAREIAEKKIQHFENVEKAIEVGIRIGFSYMTGGVVTAPLDGLYAIKIRKNDDGTNYLALYYAGPIRSAGGTASAMSVLLADYVRICCGINDYVPREEEIERFIVEVEDYSTKVTKKQYVPSREEIYFITKNLKVELNGIPTETIEVSNFKDLERVETNRIRGGMCLVLLDGIPLKASKLKKKLLQYGYDLGLKHWKWIEEYVEMQAKIKAAGKKEEGSLEKYIPVRTFLEEIVAGRPVFSHPGAFGGFRLRYGRSRASGLLSFGFNPATLYLCDNFLVTGTQIRTEYPGKAGIVTLCDSVLGPVVRLKNGDVVEINTIEEARMLNGEVEKILFLGDILVSYGDVSNQGKILLPSGYVEEWWVQELELALKEKNVEDFKRFLNLNEVPSAEEAIKISKTLKIPLHPRYTYLWHYLTKEEFLRFYNALKEGNVSKEGLLLPYNVKDVLEKLLLPHKVKDGLLISNENHTILKEIFKLEEDLKEKFEACVDFLSVVEEVSGIKIRNKMPTFIGARMGRPEKAFFRTMKGKPQVLFPCGKYEGGRLRDLMEAYKKNFVVERFVLNYCVRCNRIQPYFFCMNCGGRLQKMRRCVKCKRKTFEEKHCGVETVRYDEIKINVKELMDFASNNINEPLPDALKSPRAVMSKDKIVEPLEKGILRAKYRLYVNKDGTIRYDATNAPLTHFKPCEIHVTVDEIRALGYTKDIYGNEVTSEDQILLLMPQDIIISDNPESSCAEYLLNVGRFIDDLLVKFYKMEPYYNFKRKEDLLGHYVVGLAPHTSAGIIGRIIGFTKAKCCFAHPYWHAAKRRNADGDEDSIMLLMDPLLNFSKHFLPEHVGGRSMDAPLVLSAILKVDEVDDEAWGVDVAEKYPLEFYEATLQYKYPWSVKVKTFADKIKEKDSFYSNFTHNTSRITYDEIKSAYVNLKEMSDKVSSQLKLAERILAVDENDVAELLLETHFLVDIKGNLRTFSKQEFRCTTCNEKYRRIPLKGVCRRCNKKLNLTVFEGTVKKYLEHSCEIATKYRVSEYTLQQIQNLKKYIQSIFGKEVKQKLLGVFLNNG